MRRRLLKSALPAVAALTLGLASSHAIAQSQEDQQACENDVFNLCGDAVPDQDKIVVCLRKHWSKVSKECRHVMVTYAKEMSKEKKGQSSDKSAVGARNASDY